MRYANISDAKKMVSYIHRVRWQIILQMKYINIGKGKKQIVLIY